MPIQHQVTCVSGFDKNPGVYYFGEQNLSVFSIKIFLNGSVISSEAAHAGIITCFEHAVIGEVPYLFSGSKDMKVKVWSISQ